MHGATVSFAAQDAKSLSSLFVFREVLILDAFLAEKTQGFLFRTAANTTAVRRSLCQCRCLESFSFFFLSRNGREYRVLRVLLVC